MNWRDAGFSVAKVATRLGVSQPTVTRWRTGRSTPSPALQSIILTAVREFVYKPMKMWILFQERRVRDDR